MLTSKEQFTAAAKERVVDALGGAAAKLRAELGESLCYRTEIRCSAGAGYNVFPGSFGRRTVWAAKAGREKGYPAADLPFIACGPSDLDPNFAIAYAWLL